MNKQLVANLPILFISMPIIITFVIYFISYRLKRQKWRAIYMSAQGSAIFYVLAVVLLLEKIVSVSFTSYLLIFIIVVLSIILIVQWKQTSEVMLSTAVKLLSRMLFLLFLLIYLGLLLYVLVNFIITTFIS